MLAAPSFAFTKGRIPESGKLRQLLLMQPVHAELMLDWQVSRQKFSLVVLPVAHMDTQHQIRTLEMMLIQRWNPSLNFPFILKKKQGLNHHG